MDVLPAILGRSEYLQDSYGKPIYGKNKQIPSLNFSNWTWVKSAIDGTPINPYKQLPSVFSTQEHLKIQLLTRDDSLANGEAALIAYSRLQFEQMSDCEHNKLRAALLRYCELDTLAMVMIYEHWKYDILNSDNLQ